MISWAMPMKPIMMVGVDGSKYAEHALNTAIKIAKLFNWGLVIASVHSYPEDMGSILDVAPSELNEAKLQLKRMLEKYKSKALEAGVADVKIKALSNFTPLMSVGAVLVMEAEKMRCSLIVVGTRGMTGIKRTLLGSVADYVVKNAHCDVYVTRLL